MLIDCFRALVRPVVVLSARRPVVPAVVLSFVLVACSRV